MSALQSPLSIVQLVLGIGLSSAVLMVLFLLVFMAATVVCIPFFIVVNVISVMKFGSSDEDDVDPSVFTGFAQSQTEFFVERIFLELFSTIEGILSTKSAGWKQKTSS